MASNCKPRSPTAALSPDQSFSSRSSAVPVDGVCPCTPSAFVCVRKGLVAWSRKCQGFFPNWMEADSLPAPPLHQLRKQSPHTSNVLLHPSTKQYPLFSTPAAFSGFPITLQDLRDRSGNDPHSKHQQSLTTQSPTTTRKRRPLNQRRSPRSRAAESPWLSMSA